VKVALNIRPSRKVLQTALIIAVVVLAGVFFRELFSGGGGGGAPADNESPAEGHGAA